MKGQCPPDEFLNGRGTRDERSRRRQLAVAQAADEGRHLGRLTFEEP